MIDNHLILSKAGKIENCLSRIIKKKPGMLDEFLANQDLQEIRKNVRGATDCYRKLPEYRESFDIASPIRTACPRTGKLRGLIPCWKHETYKKNTIPA